MKKLQFICLVCLLNSFSSTWAENMNLIINGSFESADCGSYVTASPSKNSSLPNWVVTQGTVDCVGSTYLAASDGWNSVDLAGSPGKGGISQTFATYVGNDYQIMFDLAGNPACDSAVKHMNVSVADESRDFQFDVTGHSTKSMGWITQSFTFTAKLPQTTLTFTELTGNACGAVIDNVRVFSTIDTPPEVAGDYNKGVQDGVSQGIAQCKADPTTCGITVIDNTSCSTDTAHAVYDPRTGEVYIPFVDTPGPFGTDTQVYEVYLLQKANSFTFDLDLTRIKPR